MTETAAPYGEKKLACPVCLAGLEDAPQYQKYFAPCAPFTCRSPHCVLRGLTGSAEHWRFLAAAIDQQGDAAQEARKVIARMAARGRDA